MKLGYHTGYWSAGPPEGVTEAIALCEQLGFDSIWTAEAYGSDCVSPLAWWGASTSRVKLGTNIMQMSARAPVAAAMAALTLDHLSGGRFVLGLGASGPQVVEGWYGQPYPKPLARTREYIEIVRSVLRREVVTNDGPHYPLPYPGGTGLGKPLKPTVHPLRSDIPILLGAEGPKNVALAAEIADGWLPMFFSPKSDGFYRAALAEGFARPGARREGLDDFEIPAFLSVIPLDDVEAAADFMRPSLALYIGGMGAKTMNFHADLFARMGYEAEVDRIQALYLDGNKKDAIAAVPTALVEDVALIGPAAKIKDELQLWEQTVITTMLVQTHPALLPTIADLLGLG